MCCNKFNTGFDFLDQTKSVLKFSGSNFMWKLCFWTMNMTNIDGKYSKTPIFARKHTKPHVKQVQKWSKIIHFSQIDKILKILQSEVG